MRLGLTLSLALHAGILAAAVFTLPGPDPYKVKPQDAIQVDISNIADATKKMAAKKEPERPKENPAPPKVAETPPAEPAPKVAEEVKKAVREAKAEPEPPLLPEPVVEPPKKEEPIPDPIQDLLTKTEPPKPKKEEPKKAEAKPKEKPKKPEKKKDELDPDQIAAFLNKIDKTQAPEQSAETAAQPAPSDKNAAGSDDQIAATIIDALVQRIKECWTVPPGAREANIVVRVSFGLNTDGSVIGVPEVMNAEEDPLFIATANSAVAAVLECQTYNFLPVDQYELWKDLIINFNPDMMSQT